MISSRRKTIQRLHPTRLAGCVACKLLYGAVQPIFRYDPWHSSAPYPCREYKRRTVQLASTVGARVAVDIGCGFGEIISRVDAASRYGIDRSPQAIRFARVLYGRKATFRVASLASPQDLHAAIPEPSIDLLIMTNWLHGLPFAELRAMLTRLREAIPVQRLLMDSFRYAADWHVHNAEQLALLGKVETSVDGGDGHRDLYLIRLD